MNDKMNKGMLCLCGGYISFFLCKLDKWKPINEKVNFQRMDAYISPFIHFMNSK